MIFIEIKKLSKIYNKYLAVDNINLAATSDYIYSVNILGKKINRFVKNQVIFDIYSNGEVVKRFVR